MAHVSKYYVTSYIVKSPLDFHQLRLCFLISSLIKLLHFMHYYPFSALTHVHSLIKVIFYTELKVHAQIFAFMKLLQLHVLRIILMPRRQMRLVS